MDFESIFYRFWWLILPAAGLLIGTFLNECSDPVPRYDMIDCEVVYTERGSECL